jgi:hypothetical protein
MKRFSKNLLAIGTFAFCAISSYGYEATLDPYAKCTYVDSGTVIYNGPLPQAVNVIRQDHIPATNAAVDVIVGGLLGYSG